MSTLRRMKEQEAFKEALGRAHENSHFANSLRDGAVTFFDRGLLDVADSDAQITAICVYFAIRGGAVVMRDETDAERDAREAEHESVNYG